MPVVPAQGYGVIGMRKGTEPEEVDTVPAVSVSLATLPGVDVSVSHVSMAALPDGGECPTGAYSGGRGWWGLLLLPGLRELGGLVCPSLKLWPEIEAEAVV